MSHIQYYYVGRIEDSDVRQFSFSISYFLLDFGNLFNTIDLEKREVKTLVHISQLETVSQCKRNFRLT